MRIHTNMTYNTFVYQFNKLNHIQSELINLYIIDNDFFFFFVYLLNILWKWTTFWEKKVFFVKYHHAHTKQYNCRYIL